MPGVELRRFWVRNFKSLRDFSLEVKSRLTAVTGPSGSGKTSLVEVFELWRDVVEYVRGNATNPFLKWWGYDQVVWRHDETLPIVLGLELSAGDMRVRYELELYGRGADERVEVETGSNRLEYSGGVLRPGGVALRRTLLFAVCAGEPVPAGAGDAGTLLAAVSEVCRFAGNFAVLKELNLTELRRPQRPMGQTRLMPDASNLVPLLMQLTGGRPTQQVEETLRLLGYVSMSFPLAEDGRMYLKLTRADGVSVTQATAPTSVFKALALETALLTKPALVAVDDFDCHLDDRLQTHLMDRLANSDAYVIATATSETALRRAQVVKLALRDGETKLL